MTRSRGILFTVITIIGVYLTLELISFSGLTLLRRIRPIHDQPAQFSLERYRDTLTSIIDGSTHYYDFSKTLGWDVKPYGRYGIYEANGQGFRGRRNYSTEPAPGIVRIAAFGDSFTLCADVANEHGWPEWLSRLDPRVEVLNGGVSGYGPDQAWLRYRKIGAMMHPHIVVIGYMSENINRVVNVFRPFYMEDTGLPFAKPRFILRGGELQLIPNPIAERQQYTELLSSPGLWMERLGAHDYFFQSKYAPQRTFLPSIRLAHALRRTFLPDILRRDGRYVQESEAFRLVVRVLTGFYEKALRDGALPIIVVFPHKEDIEYYWKNGEATYQLLLAELAKDGYRVLDIQPVFGLSSDAATDLDDLVPTHYTPRANEMVARHLWRYLDQNQLLDPPSLRERTLAERLARVR